MQVRALSEERFGRRQPARRESLLDLVGHTSLVRLNRLTKGLSPGVEIWVKLEVNNPGGSVKDRAARQIIEDAIARGDLANRRLLDAAPGNMGIAYAMIGAALDVPVSLVIPEDTAVVYRRMMEIFGADIIESSAAGGLAESMAIARDLALAEPGEFWFANQFDNPSNARAHEMSTAPEIWAQTHGHITHFVCGIATGGTISGTSRGLRAESPDLVVYGCRPSEPDHGLGGLIHLDAGVQSTNLDPSAIAGTLLCETADAEETARRLAEEEGIAAGRSSGANVWTALQVAQELDSGLVVTLICDHADRYIGA